MNVPRSGRTAATIAVVTVGIAVGLFFLILRWMMEAGHVAPLRIIFLLGVPVSTVALLAAIWRRRSQTLILSAVLAGLGGISLLAMTVAPTPAIDPALRMSGAWTAGPLPLRAGWDRYLMGALLLLSGATLPFALRLTTRRLGLWALVIIRVCLWYGALWQTAEVVAGVDGLTTLFAKDIVGIQIALLAAIVIAGWGLLRGDRNWLAGLTAFGDSIVMSRLLMQMTLLPIIAVGVIGLSVRRGSPLNGAHLLLIAELSSIALAFIGLIAVRSAWTERRRASELAKAAERSPLMVHSDNGLIEYWPRGCEVLFGYTAAEAVGQRAPDLLDTEYPIPIAEIAEIIRRTGEWGGEVCQTTRDGRKLWIATQVVADRPEPDSELKLVETMADITDLKLAREALRETTESFEQVVASYELGTIDYVRKTGQARFSPQIERILGYAPGEMGTDGSLWESRFHPDDVLRLRALFLEDERARAPSRAVTFKMKRRDGEYRDLQGVVQFHYDEEGRLFRHVGVYMDITEILRDRKDAAENRVRLLELKAELAHTSRLSAMGELAAGLAHELNQPLTAVGNSVGAIEMMLKAEDKPVDGPMRQRMLRAARHAESQTVRAGEIIRRLREFIARGEADTQAENLRDLVDDALSLALPNPAAVGVSVTKAIPVAAAKVLVDRIQVQQVLVNLIRNALESMRDSEGAGAMSIIAEVRAGMTLVRVLDNGAGVSHENQSTLFSPFVSTKSDGMGVGLSICRRIIQAHGGDLWFEPSTAGGAEFCFTLPLAGDERSLVQA